MHQNSNPVGLKWGFKKVGLRGVGCQKELKISARLRPLLLARVFSQTPNLSSLMPSNAFLPEAFLLSPAYLARFSPNPSLLKSLCFLIPLHLPAPYFLHQPSQHQFFPAHATPQFSLLIPPTYFPFLPTSF